MRLDDASLLRSNSLTSRIGRAALITFLLLASSGGLLCQAASEYQVKAAYIFNFAKLAQWPADAFPSASSPIVFCVFGSDDFAGVLRTTVAGKTIGAHNVSVVAMDAHRELAPCNLVFFHSSERNWTRDIISTLKSGALLIGEDDDFLANGGMINLVVKDGKVRFQVNQSALARRNIAYDPSFLATALQWNGPAGQTPAVLRGEGRGLRFSVQPEYPTLAKQMNLNGTVQLQAVVRPDGTVKEVRVVGGHPLLAATSVEALRQWRYNPASGESVETVKISFGQ